MAITGEVTPHHLTLTEESVRSFDTVYKMSEVVHDGRRIPTMKLSTHKQTFPGRKQVYRLSRRGRIVADTLALQGEAVSGRGLLRPVMRNGQRVGPAPALSAVRRYAAKQRAGLPPELRRLEAGRTYPVRIGPRLGRLVDRVRDALQRMDDREAGDA